MAFSVMLDALFRSALATDARYYPTNGTPVDVRLMWRTPDDVFLSGAAGSTSRRRVAEVRISEVATANEGDSFTVGTDAYTVDRCSQPDPDVLLWRLEVVPA